MKPLDEALVQVLGSFSALEAETVPLADALGRFLAEPLVALADQPAFDNSAMDGWALRHGDGDGPRMRAAGESRAGGGLPPPLGAGEAMRIFTGAPMPAGADTVVLQEDTVVDRDRVRFTEPPRAGQHVRQRASDFAAGDRLASPGTAMSPGALALTAGQGLASIAVHRRPRVAIVPCGDELQPLGTTAPPGTIYDSNGPMLEALVRQAGGIPDRRPAVGDELKRLVAGFGRALDDADLLLTTGGVSVGDHDLVKDAFDQLGVSLDLWKVRVKPGKPLAYGRRERDGRPVLGLPGNPASAFVTFTLFARPAIRRLLGDPRPGCARVRARLLDDLRHRPGRTELARARVERLPEGLVVAPHPNQGSGALVALGTTNALVVIPAEADGLAAGDEVDALLLDGLPGEPWDLPMDT